ESAPSGRAQDARSSETGGTGGALATATRGRGTARSQEARSAPDRLAHAPHDGPWIGIPEPARIHDLAAVDQNRQLSQTPSLNGHVHGGLFSKLRGHTGRDGRLDQSNRAVPDEDTLHGPAAFFDGAPAAFFDGAPAAFFVGGPAAGRARPWTSSTATVK